jgi:hypothetical protein
MHDDKPQVAQPVQALSRIVSDTGGQEFLKR